MRTAWVVLCLISAAVQLCVALWYWASFLGITDAPNINGLSSGAAYLAFAVVLWRIGLGKELL